MNYCNIKVLFRVQLNRWQVSAVGSNYWYINLLNLEFISTPSINPNGN